MIGPAPNFTSVTGTSESLTTWAATEPSNRFAEAAETARTHHNLIGMPVTSDRAWRTARLAGAEPSTGTTIRSGSAITRYSTALIDRQTGKNGEFKRIQCASKTRESR